MNDATALCICLNVLRQLAAMLGQLEAGSETISESMAYRQLSDIAMGTVRRIEEYRRTRPSHWDNDPDYPVGDWKYEVDNDDTRLGYAEWVEVRKEQAEEEEEAS